MKTLKFTIHQTGESSALDRIHDFLSKDSSVTDISEQSGRHYSVPDRDDLPEWTSLWVHVRVKDFDALKAYVDDLQDRLSNALGHEVVNMVTFTLS